MFIPKQIRFWNKFNIRFVAVFVGATLPAELAPYKENIILWTRNSDINDVFVAQNIRIYYPALLTLPDDELVMITDMDMLPMNEAYYTAGLESFEKKDFIYYRHIDGDQIYMCYNAAHPSAWASAFGIRSDADIETALRATYQQTYSGVPGHTGWFSDQLIMYKCLIRYPHLNVLNRPIKRLECRTYMAHLSRGDTKFVHLYDDFPPHRDYFTNLPLILDAERQLSL